MYSFAASPGRVANSSEYEAMCLYHLAACGYFAASGADFKALKVATSAWDAEYLLLISLHSLVQSSRKI